MNNLTLEQKIGQLMMIGWQTDQAKDVIELIKKYHYGNIILFTRNIKNSKQLKSLTSEIQKAAIKYNGVPAFIAIDQEGGSVRRIYHGVTNIPGHMAIGASSFTRPKVASEIGHIIGSELKSLGINFILAPVADVNTNPMNPIIGIRAFSDDPYLVSKLAGQMSKAIQEEGVLSCYKHFIGHGDVHIDSHLDLPCLDKTIEDLRQTELIPYSQSFMPDAVMTAHILYRSLDNRFPASISKKIIDDLLRKELGFEGLVVSDCMEMDALTRAFSLSGAAVFAFQATCDIITLSHSFGRQLMVRNALIDAVNNKNLSLELIDHVVERIISYKEKYCLEVNEECNFEKNRLLAEAASLASITIASGKPFAIDHDTVVIGVVNYVSSVAEDKNVEELDIAKMLGEEFKVPYHSIDNKNFNVSEVQNFAKGKKIILALTDSHLTLVQKVLYANLIQTDSKIMLISLRTPYDILHQQLPDCHICIYEYTKLSIKSLIQVLKGSEAKGQLPVNLGKSAHSVKDLKNYLIDNILSYIDENYAKPLNLEIIAEEFLISSGYLCRLFKKKIGLNFVKYINLVRLEKVKHLLLTTNLRVNEIAYLCGYSDLNYFIKVFKNNTGVTPMFFRNNSGYYD